MIKPIKGSWCEFQHHNKAEGIYWNPTCARFTAADWDAKVAEMASVGLEYLVLMAVALDYKAFYPTDLLPSWELPCEDPLEALLTAGDAHGVRIFVGNGFWGQWDSPDIIAASAKRNHQPLAGNRNRAARPACAEPSRPISSQPSYAAFDINPARTADRSTCSGSTPCRSSG